MTPIYRYPARQYKGNFAVTGTLRTDASAYITGPLQGATGVVFNASALIGDASSDAVGFGGDAAAAAAFVADVTASDLAVITALSSIVDALQGKGIMGAS